MVRVVSVEGNIASGKSTLLEHLKDHYKSDSGIVFVGEPVDEWRSIKDSAGVDMLTKFYADPSRYSFAFQMMAYISRLSLLKKALASGAEVVITERCVLTDRNVFASMLREEGRLEDAEYQIYTRWFNEFIGELPQPEIVYVRTSPETCLARAAMRNRHGEAVPLPYLRKVHAKHEAWLLHPPTTNRMLTLNADLDTSSHPNVVLDWLREIGSFVRPGDGRSGIESAPPTRPGWLLQCDGASRGNPGCCGAGWVLFHEGTVASEGTQYLSDHATNNWAEYQALLGGLACAQQKCPRFGCEPLTVEVDSKLVVNQVNGTWETKDATMRALCAEVRESISRVGRVRLVHIPRHLNAHADRLANQAIDNHDRACAVSMS